jgi:hypothetical protein
LPCINKLFLNGIMRFDPQPVRGGHRIKRGSMRTKRGRGHREQVSSAALRRQGCLGSTEMSPLDNTLARRAALQRSRSMPECDTVESPGAVNVSRLERRCLPYTSPMFESLRTP